MNKWIFPIHRDLGEGSYRLSEEWTPMWSPNVERLVWHGQEFSQDHLLHDDGQSTFMPQRAASNATI